MKNFKTLCITIIVLFCINESVAQCSAPPAQAWNWAGPSVVSNSNRLFGTRNIAYDEFHNIYTVANLEGGSVTIGGFTVSAYYGFDNILIKQDQNGNVIWVKSFGSSQNDMENSVHKIVCDQNGSFYISFNCTNMHINGVFEPITNVNASHIIQFDYNGNYVADLYPAGGAGGISALEFYNGELFFSDDNTIKKRNALGIISTVVTLNNTSTIRIWNIKHAPNGDWIINGYFTSPLSYDGVTLNEYTSPSVQSAEFIFRLNSSNQVVYALRMDGLADFYSGSLGIAFDNQSNLLFGGIPQGPVSVNQWRFQNTTMTLDYSANSAIVIKIDAASGNMLWNRQFRSQVSYTGNMLYLLCNPNNEILVVGSYTNGGVVPYAVCLPDYQNFILKLNANGEKIYFQNFGLGGGSFQSRMAITTWDYCKYFITGKGGDLFTVNNPNYNCLTFPNTGMYFTASFNDYSFEIDGNGIDDDCDGQIDEDNPNYQRWFRDVDGDGFGNTVNSIFGCSAPAGYVGNRNDCDDNNAQIGYTNWYVDADSDGYGDANDPGVPSCTPLAGKTNVHGDCNDGNATIHPGATEVCNGIDDNCDGIIDNFSSFATTGLIGYWAFDGNLNDQTINHNNGTGFGGISYTTGLAGKVNGALIFDGQNDYVEIPHISAYNLGTGNFTMSYWFNTSSTAGSQVISKAPSGNGPYPYLGIASYSGSGNISARTQFQSSIDALITGLNNSQWHQVVFSRNGNLLSLYINGILKNSASFTADNISNVNKLVLGRNQDIFQYMYNGSLDNLRLYNRTLSSAEISSLFNYEQNGIIYPPPVEVCNGVDDNCDGLIDEGFPQNTYYADADGDSFGDPAITSITCVTAPPSGYVTNNKDCDDNNASVYPGATEICNGIDDDCDGFIDEGVQTTLYRDQDSDGYGNLSVTIQACTVPSGYVGNSTDCNDGNAAIHPGAIEVCNGIDDDCDGSIDEGVQTTFYRDQDGDGYGNLSVTIQACTVPSGYVGNSTDCNDGNAAIHPGAIEVCNGIDDDCDGSIDEGVQTTFYRDQDGDGYGNLSVTIQACTVPSGYVSNSTDCNDGNAAIHPGAIEVCNGIDDDCDGLVDELATGGTLPVVTASGPLAFCAGGSVTLTSSGGNSYLWSSGAITQSITVSQSGTYSVTVTSLYGCSATSAVVTVVVNSLPAEFSLTSIGGECNTGAPKYIGLSGSQNGVYYQLKLNGATNIGSPIPGTGLAISFGNQTTAGTYTVLAVNTSTNCSSSMIGNIIISSTGTLPALTATCTNNNPILYFGFTLDQMATITVKPSGGMAPYKVSFTMNRPINCNLINSSGDEIWKSGANTESNSYTTCPASGSSLGNPVSTSTSTITSAIGYQVNVTLMQDAIITSTITDANGCTYTCSTSVHAEDVRCFAGNSNMIKVIICHQTGSIKNPCVRICVDQSAVQAHMDHGDFLGNCTPNCTAPIAVRSSPLQLPAEVFEVTVVPNPTTTFFNVIIKGKDASPVTLRVLDVYGRLLQVNQKLGAFSSLRIGDKWPGGTYFVEVLQGGERKVLKVIKAK